MKKYLLDTNVLLRYLLNDIKPQANLIEEYFKKASRNEIILSIPLLSFVELDFALIKYYGFAKIKVVKYSHKIIDKLFLDIEKRDLLFGALRKYSKSNISLVDAIFCTQAQIEGKELLTFDRRLKKLSSL